MRANLFGELDRRLAHMVDDVLIRDFVRMWHGVNVASRGPQWICLLYTSDAADE